MSAATKDGSEFATYGPVTIEYRDASHRYWIIQGTERRPVTSVTSALKIIDKPALLKWAETIGIEDAIRLEREGSIVDFKADEVPDAVRQMGFGATAKRDAGGDRGNALHDALLAYCSLGTPPNVGDFPAEQRGYVSGLCKWLIDAEPEPVRVECIVGHPAYNFAGRFDLLAKIDGELVLVDLKTSKRAYMEHHLQLAGYEIGLVECTGELPDRSAIVSVDEEGGFLETTGLAYPDEFLDALKLCQSVAGLNRRIKAAA